MARREEITTTVGSRGRLEQATVAYFEILPADAVREELEMATALDAHADESDFQDAP